VNLSKPLIYLITKGDLTSENYSVQSFQTLQIIESAIKSGISMIQIREKNLPLRLLFDLTTKSIKIRKNPKTKILVNDRADVALAAKADGVHLTSKSISARIIRQNFPRNFIIGVSTHTVEEVVKSEKDRADFVTFGPIFQTPEKEKYGTPQGVEKLAKVVETAQDFPVIALGGINQENLFEVLNAGASGLAAIRLLNNVEKLPYLVKNIQKMARKNEE
jgi:thiamine-phosphate pyrophosphorylase